jgi:hypothetical protein
MANNAVRRTAAAPVGCNFMKQENNKMTSKTTKTLRYTAPPPQHFTNNSLTRQRFFLLTTFILTLALSLIFTACLTTEPMGPPPDKHILVDSTIPLEDHNTLRLYRNNVDINGERRITITAFDGRPVRIESYYDASYNDIFVPRGVHKIDFDFYFKSSGGGSTIKGSASGSSSITYNFNSAHNFFDVDFVEQSIPRYRFRITPYKDKPWTAKEDPFMVRGW